MNESSYEVVKGGMFSLSSALVFALFCKNNLENIVSVGSNIISFSLFFVFCVALLSSWLRFALIRMLLVFHAPELRIENFLFFF